jgi:hypothetical protein
LDKDDTSIDDNSPDIGEVTQQFDLNALDKDDTSIDDNSPDIGDVTEQFDLNVLGRDDTSIDDDSPDIGDVTEQFDLNALNRDDTIIVDNSLDIGEVTEQFDLNALNKDDTIIVDNSLDIGEVTEQFDLNTFNEDNSRDEADENLGATAGNESAATQNDEDVFDLEEEIELEYELDDDDEDELIELKDERTEDNQDFVDLMLGVSKESDQSDDDEVTQYLKFETEEQGDIIVLDADRDQVTGFIALPEEETSDFVDSDDLPDLEALGRFDFEDEEDGLAPDEPEAHSSEDLLAEEETPEFVDSDDLPDLEAISGFDFGDEEDGESETDSSDDIIARAVDRSLGDGDDREPIDLADETQFGLLDDDAIMDLDGSSEDEDIILALADEEPLTPEDDEDLLDLNGGADLETDDEIIPLDDFDDLEVKNGEDIIEITEFDQHFPADGEALLKQSGILDASGADEDDFLELIDVEEDSLSDDEAIVEFSDLAQKAEESDITKINQFFSDDLQEDQSEPLTPSSKFSDEPDDILQKDEAAESIFDGTETVKFRLNDEVPAIAEKASDLDPESTSNAEIPTSEVEKFDFDFDHSSIAQQVDRLDTFLSEDAADEPAVASLPVDQVAEEEGSGRDNSPIEQGLNGLPAIPAGQINAAIERVINEKFSAKIEGIIYEVIEKAVAKEIDRLKGALIGNHTIDDYED